MIHETDYLRATELLQSRVRRRVSMQVTWYRFLAWCAKPIVAVAVVMIAASACGWALARCCR